MSEQFNGYVKVKDGTKGALDYSPNREIEVSISFATEVKGDLEGLARQSADLADAIVNEKLGRVNEAPAKTVKATKATKPPSADKPATPPPAPPAAKPAADPSDMGGSGQSISTGGERNDPASMGGGLDDLMTPVAPAPITDSHLMAAITRVNAKFEGKKAPEIRNLILAYVPKDGKHHQAHEIEQEKRQAFLVELDKVG